MAAFVGRICSSEGKVCDEEKLQELLSRWELPELEVTIEDGVFYVAGYTWPLAYHLPRQEDEESDWYGFLKELALCVEQMEIMTIGGEKCCHPFCACKWEVENGRLEHTCL